jgi:predicted NUDIX family NTP pyrophosphohydrolase
MAKHGAGLLIVHRTDAKLQVLFVHTGGGLVNEGEDEF